MTRAVGATTIGSLVAMAVYDRDCLCRQFHCGAYYPLYNGNIIMAGRHNRHFPHHHRQCMLTMAARAFYKATKGFLFSVSSFFIIIISGLKSMKTAPEYGLRCRQGVKRPFTIEQSLT